MDAIQIQPPRSSKILVKPNLLLPKMLACAHPLIVGAVCRWLLDNGCHPFVSDSPGFGSVKKISHHIGLDQILKKLDVPLVEMDEPIKISIKLANGKTGRIPVSAKALQCDAIFSVAKVKAHAQMRMTMSVKNCFGCVPGMQKAFTHAAKGGSHDLFAQYLAGLWERLPPVTGICDGIMAMNETGPIKGKPFKLGLIGACASAPALDLAILEIIGVSPKDVPLSKILLKKYPELTLDNAIFPLMKPEDFHVEGFQTPQKLASASFSPPRLLKSLLKRMWNKLNAPKTA